MSSTSTWRLETLTNDYIADRHRWHSQVTAYVAVLSSDKDSSRRSSNGCATCKLRRVKCDEAKPSCRGCRIGARICVYDKLLTNIFLPVEHYAASFFTPARSRKLNFHLWNPLSSKDCSKRLSLFQYYCERIAPSCQTNGVPVVAHISSAAQLRASSPAIDYLISALAYVHQEAWEASSQTANSAYYFCLLGKAMALMQDDIPGEALAVAVYMLVSCEIIRTGDSQQAADHLDAFTTALAKWQHSTDRVDQTQLERRREVSTRYFTVFQIAAAHFRKVSDVVQISIAGHDTNLLPFTSVAEAADVLEDLFVAWTARLVKDNQQSWIQPFNFDQLCASLSAWTVLLENLGQKLNSRGPVPAEDTKVLRALQMHCRLWIAAFAWMNPLFEFSIQTEREMLENVMRECECLMQGATNAYIENLPISSLGPLGFIALCSRVHSLRKRASDLLGKINVHEGNMSSRSLYFASRAIDGVYARDWNRSEEAGISETEMPHIRPLQVSFHLNEDTSTGRQVVRYQKIHKRNVYQGSACIDVLSSHDVAACLGAKMSWPDETENRDSLQRLQRARRRRACDQSSNLEVSNHIPSMYITHRYPLLAVDLCQSYQAPSMLCQSLRLQESQNLSSRSDAILECDLPQPPDVVTTSFQDGSQMRLRTLVEAGEHNGQAKLPTQDSTTSPAISQRPDSTWIPIVIISQMALLRNPEWKSEYNRQWSAGDERCFLHPKDLSLLENPII